MTNIDEAYARLRDDIVQGRLMPNERLVEAELALALGIGRTGVRTLLGRLEHDGLVVHTPHRGARVRMVTEAEALEITEARAVLEGLTARAAARHATPEDVTVLREILARMAGYVQAGDLLAYSECNARLHAAIIDISAHRTAARLIGGLKAQTVRFQYRTVLVPGRSTHSLAEHTRIVEAIAAGDAEEAEIAMRQHLSQVAGTLRQTASARAQHGAHSAGFGP
jgi:DNA-binding GntR family transcriptional regulator